MSIEQKVKFDSTRAERAFQAQRYADGWARCAIKSCTPKREPDQADRGEAPSPNYFQLEIDFVPMESEDPASGVGRGLRKWQILPFEPDEWQELMAEVDSEGNPRLSEADYQIWQAELDAAQKDCYRLARAWWPDAVPALPRRQGDELFYNGEPIASDEYNNAAADAVATGCAKLGEVLNAGGFNGVEGKVVYALLGNTKRDGQLAKRTYMNLILGEHPINLDTGAQEAINMGRGVIYTAAPAATQGAQVEEPAAPTPAPTGTTPVRVKAAPAPAKPNGVKGKAAPTPAATKGKPTSKSGSAARR